MRNIKIVLRAFAWFALIALPVFAQDSPFATTATAINLDATFWLRSIAVVIVGFAGVMLLLDRGGGVGGKITTLVIGLVLLLGAQRIVDWVGRYTA